MQQLSFLPGEMTPGERSLILRALKTLDRHLHEPGVAFTSTRAAREWLILNMAGLEREEFRVLYLNNQNQLIAGETLFTGTINRTEVHPREVIKRALYHNAAAVVLAHNHPSGEVTPSKADRLITERLVQALGLVDIRVPDMPLLWCWHTITRPVKSHPARQTALSRNVWYRHWPWWISGYRTI